ncbi:hypothetical protein niasHT_028518 [Heterodera trifolii]|uniref:Uncharacterized protein n=1 Tax=Heterodera trifolii TaxID=157864 RepID=A0ABD2KPW4_9BILA
MKCVGNCACSGEGVKVISMVHSEIGNKNVCVASIRCACRTGPEMTKWGKRKKFGLYRSHKGMIRQMDVSIGYMAIQDIFKQRPGTGCYNLATFNCQHWNNEFFDKGYTYLDGKTSILLAWQPFDALATPCQN